MKQNLFFFLLLLGIKAQASSHYTGTKHAKKLLTLDAPDSKIRTCEPVSKETAVLLSSCSRPSSSDTTSGGECISATMHAHMCTDITRMTPLAIWMHGSDLLFLVTTLTLWCDKPPAALGCTVKWFKVGHYPLLLLRVYIFWPHSVVSWDQKSIENALNMICG